MALKAKVANKPIIDDKGYTVGVIKNILEIEERTEKQGRKEVRYAPQFEFIVISEGSLKPLTLRFWTGQTLNNEKFGDKKDYNRLTRLSLQLGLIETSDLDKLKEVETPDFEKLVGIEVKFKLEKSQKAQGLSVIDISSIELVK